MSAGGPVRLGVAFGTGFDPMARFEFTQGSSSKFWEVSQRGTKVTVRWGRIGTTGQSKVKTFANALKAGEFQVKLVREKIGKSYIPCDKEANRLATADVPESAKKRPAKKVVSPAKTSRPKGGAKDLSPRKRLRAAFEELKSHGIVTLENAGYTQSDGWDDVNEIATKLADAGQRPRAGVFYHGQDTARGRRGEGLFLTFGSYARKHADKDSVAVGRLIVETLKAHGFDPEWDGTIHTRIHTGKFEWR